MDASGSCEPAAAAAAWEDAEVELDASAVSTPWFLMPIWRDRKGKTSELKLVWTDKQPEDQH